MSIYKIKSFEKCIKKLPVTDTALHEAATEVMNGLFDADLGGGVIKKRVSLGGGKSSGMRTVVFFKTGKHLFFADGWPKVVRAKRQKEITAEELTAYRALADVFLAATDKQIETMLTNGIITEVKNGSEHE